MSDSRSTARRAVVGVAAAAAIAVGAAPFAFAQSAVDTNSVDTDSAANTGGANGSLNTDFLAAEDGSLSKFVPNSQNTACELPELGGSVKTLAPYLGLGVPSFVLNMAAQALDSIDNPLTMADVDVHELGLGSLEAPLCSAVLGGTMASETSTSASTTVSTSASTAASTSASSSSTQATSSSVPTSTSKVATAGSTDFGSLNSGSFNPGS